MELEAQVRDRIPRKLWRKGRRSGPTLTGHALRAPFRAADARASAPPLPRAPGACTMHPARLRAPRHKQVGADGLTGPSERPRLLADVYDVSADGPPLGTGAFAVTHRALHRATGEHRACKSVDKAHAREAAAGGGGAAAARSSDGSSGHGAHEARALRSLSGARAGRATGRGRRLPAGDGITGHPARLRPRPAHRAHMAPYSVASCCAAPRRRKPFPTPTCAPPPSLNPTARLPQGHPHIIALEDAFEDEAHVHLVMELCEGGSLLEAVMARVRASSPRGQARAAGMRSARAMRRRIAVPAPAAAQTATLRAFTRAARRRCRPPPRRGATPRPRRPPSCVRCCRRLRTRTAAAGCTATSRCGGGRGCAHKMVHAQACLLRLLCRPLGDRLGDAWVTANPSRTKLTGSAIGMPLSLQTTNPHPTPALTLTSALASPCPRPRAAE
jgi:hypothetical protein